MSFHDLPGRTGAVGYSDIVVANGFAFLAGKVAADSPDPVQLGSIEEETRICLDLLARSLKLAGLSMENVVRSNVYMTDLAEFERMDAVYRTHFRNGRMPARTTIGAATLVFGCRVEIDCVAIVPA
jgi:2-iminobutanoate/2-iminopropanoate deaminase